MRRMDGISAFLLEQENTGAYQHTLKISILDTAGLRSTEDVVEGIGIQRAKDRAEQADLRVYLVSGDEDVEVDTAARLRGTVFEDGKGAAAGRSRDTLHGTGLQGADE